MAAPSRRSSRSPASTSRLVGQVAADIRASRPPEPYQGKGIRYTGRVHLPQGRQEEVRTPGHGSTLARTVRIGARRACAARSKAHAARPCRACRCIRSSKHIYAQVIDDAQGTTVAAASTLEKDLEGVAQDRRRQGRGRRRSASSSPSGPSRPASRTSSSTAAAIIYPRPRQGAGRRRARRRPELLIERGIERGTSHQAETAAGIATSAIASSPTSSCTSIASPRW